MALLAVWKRFGLPRYRTLPEQTRWAIAGGFELAIAVLFFFVDHALGYAVLTAAGLYWMTKLPLLPWRLAAQLVLITIFLVTGVPSLAVLLAIAFAMVWEIGRAHV